MKKTMYLTGQHPSRYKELIEPLANQRIKDMRYLLGELRKAANRIENGSPLKNYMIKRYQDVEEAIEFWRALLEEGNIDVEDN